MKRVTGCLAILACRLLPALAAAQGTTGSISGAVIDAQKAVVPGVTITVTQVETGAERTLVSAAQGRYHPYFHAGRPSSARPETDVLIRQGHLHHGWISSKGSG